MGMKRRKPFKPNTRKISPSKYRAITDAIFTVHLKRKRLERLVLVGPYYASSACYLVENFIDAVDERYGDVSPVVAHGVRDRNYVVRNCCEFFYEPLTAL
jgi:hypothetical protein